MSCGVEACLWHYGEFAPPVTQSTFMASSHNAASWLDGAEESFSSTSRAHHWESEELSSSTARTLSTKGRQQRRACFADDREGAGHEELRMEVPPLSDGEALGLGLTGLEIRSVLEPSPAAQAKLRCGDIIKSINGLAVHEQSELLSEIERVRERAIGMTIVVQRRDRSPRADLEACEMPVVVTRSTASSTSACSRRGASTSAAAAAAAAGWVSGGVAAELLQKSMSGLSVTEASTASVRSSKCFREVVIEYLPDRTPLGATLAGLKVTALKEGTPGWMKLRIGDTIGSINGKPVTTQESFLRHLAQARPGPVHLGVGGPQRQDWSQSAMHPVSGAMVLLNADDLGHFGSKTFSWKSIVEAASFFDRHTPGVTVKAVCSSKLLARSGPLPQSLVGRILCPPAEEEQHFLLRLAQEHNCRFVDNSTYRANQFAGRNKDLWDWVSTFGEQLSVPYIFDTFGQFVPARNVVDELTASISTANRFSSTSSSR